MPLHYGVHLLNESLFNSEGEICCEKAAQQIINDKNFSVSERFKVVCGYVVTDNIVTLWDDLPVDERDQLFFAKGQDSAMKQSSHHEDVKVIQQSQLPRLWAYYLTGKIARTSILARH